LESNKKNNSTLKNIADHIGVSVSTVSRVLSGKASDYRISKETEKNVREVAKKLNYSPNQLARGLRLKKTNVIGLVIPDISNPFFASIAKSVESEARKAGYSIMLCDTQEDTKIEISSLQLLWNRKVDGVIICPVGQESKHLERLWDTGFPMVVIDRYFPELECPSIISDNYQGALDGVNYLLENNHRIIGCIQGFLKTSVNDDRVRGYRDAHKTHNITFDDSLIVGDSFGEQNGYISAKILLNRTVKPTAFFTFSNLICLGVIHAIKEENLRIPEDISIVSFDDHSYANYLSTPISTIVQQKDEMGVIASKLLTDQIESGIRYNTKGVVLPTKLVIRKSVKKLENN